MKKTLPLLSANLLYALTMLLVITVGSLSQSKTLTWGLIVTELLFIGLPTLLFLRQARVPLRIGLRLNPIPPVTAILCVILGMALYLLAILIEGLMLQATGMQSVPVPNELLPKTDLDMALFALGMVILAPLCEEMLFRGAIQGAYEARKSPRFAIAITALMFAFYHFRLSGLPGLLPIAFVLGYVAWRTRSIYATMLVHFGNNGLSALQSILYEQTGAGLPFLGLWSALLGLILAIVILLIIRRIHPAMADASSDPSVPIISGEGRTRLATYWPLLIAAALYISVAAITLAESLPGKALPADQIAYGLPSLSSPVETHYEIVNQGGHPVGDMTCTVAPQGASVHLNCKRSIRAYEYRQGNSIYIDGDHEDTLRAEWDAQTMALESFAYELIGAGGSRFTSIVKDGVVTSEAAAGAETLALEPHALIEFEWAWRVALLKANRGDRYSVPFVRLMMWDESKQKSAPVIKPEIVTVGNEETLTLPDGAVPARKLTVGQYAAWYARADALAGLPRPAKFDDGVLIYTMVDLVD